MNNFTWQDAFKIFREQCVAEPITYEKVIKYIPAQHHKKALDMWIDEELKDYTMLEVGKGNQRLMNDINSQES